MRKFHRKQVIFYRIWKKETEELFHIFVFHILRQKIACLNKSCLHGECNVEQSRFRPRPADELKTDGQPGLIVPNLVHRFANHVNLLLYHLNIVQILF